MSKTYRIYNKKTQIVEEIIHTSFKERKKDVDQKAADLKEEMESLSLNNNAHNQQDLQIATRIESDVYEFPTHQYVSDDISKNHENHLSREDTLEQEI